VENDDSFLCWFGQPTAAERILFQILVLAVLLVRIYLSLEWHAACGWM
jgi:hypothetical protein